MNWTAFTANISKGSLVSRGVKHKTSCQQQTLNIGFFLKLCIHNITCHEDRGLQAIQISPCMHTDLVADANLYIFSLEASLCWWYIKKLQGKVVLVCLHHCQPCQEKVWCVSAKMTKVIYDQSTCVVVASPAEKIKGNLFPDTQHKEVWVAFTFLKLKSLCGVKKAAIFSTF